MRTTVRPFCAIWTPQGGGKRESCVYSNAKINLLFRIEEVFAKQFSDFLRTVVMIDKNKWTFFRMLSCFVSFSASFGGKPRVFFFSFRRRLLLACVGTPKRTRACIAHSPQFAFLAFTLHLHPQCVENGKDTRELSGDFNTSPVKENVPLSSPVKFCLSVFCAFWVKR